MVPPRPRRSALFLPTSNPRAIAKSRALPCDVVILDLEDAVAPDMKDDARARAVAAVTEGGFGDRELVVRVNAANTRWHMDDLIALTGAPIDAILLPKVGDVTDVKAARDCLGHDGPALWAMIESACGVLNLPAIAAGAADAKLTALVAGTNDLAIDLRCRPGPDRASLLSALAQIVIAARAVGMTALDGVLNAIDQPDRLAAECDQGRAWGFDGKTLIHPAQIDAANAAFGPSTDDIAWAARVIAAFADPDYDGRGAIRLDGAMVERLHLQEAERILALIR
ncbi:malyl-CoA thiolesterase [Sphingomonas sp. Leaf339]|uniref:HpcH/HpaI aldolase/citrate lyase family protein n=1 Tax=Sphingomonas sp. Leaf339 TaxID=1736343 RepID=UPI0006F39F6F|nr:CoA ester lyase [Sphingomonas sp. Leaf339]KQU61805.1 malyl-CoA thiolesterase [Sphingomonas sp. Leaf339]